MTTTTKTATAGRICADCGYVESQHGVSKLHLPCKGFRPQLPEHDAGLRDERGGEHQTLTDAARVAELEAEGLTHSDAVGVMEAEKLARQPEPATGEWWAMLTQGERDYFIRSAWSLPKASHDAARIAAGENASLEKNNEPHWQISGYTESSRLDGQRVVRVTAPHPDGGGFDVAEVLESEASMVVAAVNVHTQLVAALEQAHELLYSAISDRKVLARNNLYRTLDTVAEALRLAKDGE